MAQYFEDWSGHDLGAGVPDGWTSRWVHTGKTFTIVESEDSPSGKALRIVHSSARRTFLSFDILDEDDDKALSDTIILIKMLGQASSGAATFIGIGSRGAGSGGSETGNFAALGQASPASRDSRANTYSNGSTGSQVNGSAGVWAVGDIRWLRERVTESSRTIYLYSEDDPLGTPINTYSAGVVASNDTNWLGIFSFASAVNAEVLWFGVGTGGEEPPLPGEQPEDPPQGTVTIAEVVPGFNSATVAYNYDESDASGFQYRVDNGTPASIGASPATITGLEPETFYNSPGLQIRAVNIIGPGEWSTAVPFGTEEVPDSIGIEWDIDSGNIDPNSIVITDGETTEPTIELTPRSTLGGIGPTARWIHWPFKITNANGRQPIFKVNVSGRYLGGYVAAWRPQYTTDHETWVAAPSRTISGGIAEFQFSAPFSTDEVYVADHQYFRVEDFANVAAGLLADTSGLVSVSASADEFGVIGTSPSETDDLDRQVGGHPIFGFVLGNDSPTDDGGPKRWMIVDAGCHSGEILDGFPLRGLIDFYLNGIGEQADKLRSNWKIGVYFAITPNGRYGGNWRGNWVGRYKDPNRDWGGTGAFSLAESVIVRDAMLADLDGHIEEIGLSLHTAASFTAAEQVWRNTAIADQTVQNAWLVALDDVDGVNWTRTDTNIATSVTGWHVTRGCKVGIICEFGTRTTNTVERYEQCGRRFLEATALTDAQGYFYQPAGESGGSESSVTVTSHGQGLATERAAGGSATNVAVITTGAGSAAEAAQGGSTAQLSISAQGAGFAGSDQAGGSTSAVTVSATGAGTGHESAQGGSTAAVSVIAEGSGIPSTGQSGGSTSNVIALPTGSGIAEEHSAGGSIAGISVTASGTGESSEGQASEGGSTAQIIVFPSSAGAAIERAEGGSTAGVRVKALGYTAPSFDGPAIIVTIPSENRIITIQERRTG